MRKIFRFFALLAIGLQSSDIRAQDLSPLTGGGSFHEYWPDLGQIDYADFPQDFYQHSLQTTCGNSSICGAGTYPAIPTQCNSLSCTNGAGQIILDQFRTLNCTNKLDSRETTGTVLPRFRCNYIFSTFSSPPLYRRISPQIVLGPPPGINFAPVVAILTPGYQTLCTGTAVSADMIVTAAHCACSPEAAFAYFGEKVGAIEDLNLGLRVDLKTSADNGSVSFIPEFCNSDEEARANMMDLGALRFESENINGIFIATPSTPSDSPQLWTIAGFGVTDFVPEVGPPKDEEYQSLKLGNSGIMVFPCTTNENENCLIGDEWISLPSPNTNNDTCYGDSGGPIYADKSYVGVTRARLNISKSPYCGGGGVYTRFDSDTLNDRGETPLAWIERVKGEVEWKE